MDIAKILKLESDLTLRVPVTHTLKKNGTIVTINTLTVGQVAAMHPYLVLFAEDDMSLSEEMIKHFDNKKFADMVDKYIEPMKQVVKIATGSDYADEATFEEYFILLSLIYSRMGNLYFQKSIILQSIMSPSRRPEIIAGNKFSTSEA